MDKSGINKGSKPDKGEIWKGMKDKCTHPREKIRILTEGETEVRFESFKNGPDYPYFECDCGEDVQPIGFESIDDNS